MRLFIKYLLSNYFAPEIASCSWDTSVIKIDKDANSMSQYISLLEQHSPLESPQEKKIKVSGMET